MELFADSILPDFGLRLTPEQRAKNDAVARRKAQIAADKEQAAVKKAAQAQLDAITPKVGPNSSAAGLTLEQLQNLKFSDEAGVLSRRYYDQRAQQQLRGTPPGAAQKVVLSDRALFYRDNQITTVFPATAGAVAGIPASGPAPPAVPGGTPIASTTAPKKAGGPAGIVGGAVASAAGAVVAGATSVERFFAANPPDP